MEVSISAAVNVSILAVSVIFTVLVILIFTIQALVKLMPYKATPPAPTLHKTAANDDQDDHVAAITATLAMHMGKSPNDFRITNISQR
jgi:sodium pump decarboxylase gamma subunit